MAYTPSSLTGLPLPFELRPLIRPVFAPDTTTLHGPSTQTPQAGPSKNPVIRSVDGHGQLLWVGSSDGRVKGLDIKVTTSHPRLHHHRVVSELTENLNVAQSQPRPHSASGRPSSPSSPRFQDDTSTIQEDHIDTSCFQDYHVFPLTDQSKPKPIEKLILAPMVGLAIILSEGTITFHSITDLQPCPTSSYPSIKGVSAVTLDEHTYNLDQSSKQPDVLMCVIKKKSIFLYLLSMAGVQQVHEVTFASAAFQSLLRGSTLLLSDIEQYYLLSLNEKPPQVIPLLPISQSSSMALDAPSTTSSQATRHRPSMAAIPNSQEFLLASHTGSTCLGIFVSSTGEPSRGTLQWPSNPRSVAVDVNRVLALLFNETIQVHSLETQELMHVITIPTSLDPRSLASVKFGISLPGETYTSHLNTVLFSLATPPRHSLPASSKTKGSSWCSAATQSRILLVGRDSLYALATRTFLAEVETLIRQNRWDDALVLTSRISDSQQQNKSTPSPTRSRSENLGLLNQLNYIYQKISLHYLIETRFDEAGNLWFKGRGDPRILLKLFPILSANKLCKSDQLQIFRGLIDAVREVTSAEELIMMHLVQNYSSPQHTESDENPGLSKVDLKEKLLEKARLTLLKYLHRWKRDQLLKGGASDNNRHLDSVLDIALVQLLSERRKIDPEANVALKQMLERPNSCVFSEIENVLRENGCFCILCKIYLKRNDIPKAFDIWAKLHDKRLLDEDFQEDIDQMASVLINCKEGKFVLKYGIWMAPLNPNLGVKVLVESKVADELDVNLTFQNLCEVSHEAAELYLEQIILRESQKGLENATRKNKQSNPETAIHLFDLRTQLVLGYLSKLKRLFSGSQESPSLVLNFFRRLVEEFIALSRNESTIQLSFVEYFLRYSTTDVSDEVPSQFEDAIRTRAKLMVYLDQSTSANPSYDSLKVRAIIEDMGGSAELLALERAMVYSKIGLHRPALSLLAITLTDIRSAETYCLQSGCLLSTTQANKLMAMGRISSDKARGLSSACSSNDSSSTDLLAILFDLLISLPNPTTQVKMLLFRHSSRIPLDASLERLPSDWVLDPILAPYLTRALRRSFHQTHESTIIKSIALGHKICLAISWQDHHAQSLKFLSENDHHQQLQSSTRFVEKKKG